MVTEDGKTVTLTIATDAPVTEGAGSTLPGSTLPPTVETLEPGTAVTVEVSDDGRVAQRVKARQSKVEGVIVKIEGQQVTVQSERGRQVTVNVDDRTRIELEDDFPGALADLRVGAEVKIKFDSDSLVAFKINTEEEEAEIEGVVVLVEGDEVTIETEQGRRLTLVVGDRTRIELEDDFPGRISDLQVGVEVETKFDPFTRRAFKIELEKEERKGKIKGVVIEISGNEITVETDRGHRRTITVARSARIELGDGPPGALGDLREGDEVEIRYNSVTGVAQIIELSD